MPRNCGAASWTLEGGAVKGDDALDTAGELCKGSPMAARGHKRVTIAADDIPVPPLAEAAGGAPGTCCDAIRVHGAGSVFALLEGQATSDTPTEHEFYAAGEGLGLRIRTIKGTGGGSTAMDVDLYWEEP